MNYVPDSVESLPYWSLGAAGFLILLGIGAVQDYRTREVTNGIWLLAMVWWLPFAFLAPASRSLAEPIVFWVIQELFFCRFYGRADCHAFSCCGFYWWGLGYGPEIYLIHMLVSLFLLGIGQLCKGNVDTRGNLPAPVPFVPYILLGFCGILAWIFR